MPASEAQREWVRRVLGFDLADPTAAAGAAARTAPSGRGDTLAVWRDAKDAVDGKLEALARELRSYDDEDLDAIAEFGLFGLTGGGEAVALTRALMEYGGAAAGERRAAADALREAVAGFRSAVLEGNPAVELVDDNPFGVDVALSATLGDALQQIERALA